MENYLFRGKSIFDGNWYEGSLLVFPSGRAKILKWNQADLDFDQIEVRPETVGQYTELNDKNGKSIFEGDIVVLNEDVKKTFDVDDGEVIYGRGGFYVKEFNVLNSLNTLASWDWILRGKVIGNIHDNPELMKI